MTLCGIIYYKETALSSFLKALLFDGSRFLRWKTSDFSPLFMISTIKTTALACVSYFSVITAGHALYNDMENECKSLYPHRTQQAVRQEMQNC